jgi:ABC-type transporter Mla subunit MlaD
MADPISVSAEEFARFKRAVIKKLKAQDDLIADAFSAIAALENKEDEVVDEALDRAMRAQRAVRRLEKRMNGET